MNIIYYLQFYINTIINFFIIGGYTFYIDFKNYDLKNKIQYNDRNQMLLVYKKIIPLVMFNLFVTSLLFSIIYIKILEYYQIPYYPDNYYLSIIYIFLMRYFVDIPFYICHNIFHHRYFYKYHKVHHEIKAPVGISALYFHPLDYIFGNLVPIFLTFIFFNIDYFTLHLWAFFTIFNTVYESHGGFKNLSEFHDYHHKNFKYNYGTDFIMDILFKTRRLS